MRSFLALWCVLLCLWGVVGPGRAFLRVSEAPEPAELVVQFVGPDDIARNAKAVGLVRLGLAPLLMIPGQRSLFGRNQLGSIRPSWSVRPVTCAVSDSWPNGSLINNGIAFITLPPRPIRGARHGGRPETTGGG